MATSTCLRRTARAADVELLRGRGDGTFESPVTYATIVGSQPTAVHRSQPRRQAGCGPNPLGGGPPVTVSMAVTESTVGLAAAPNPSALSGTATLTATVTPADATGTVTFYDGAIILGKAALAGGQAVLSTKWLGAACAPCARPTAGTRCGMPRAPRPASTSRWPQGPATDLGQGRPGHGPRPEGAGHRRPERRREAGPRHRQRDEQHDQRAARERRGRLRAARQLQHRGARQHPSRSRTWTRTARSTWPSPTSAASQRQRVSRKRQRHSSGGGQHRRV